MLNRFKADIFGLILNWISRESPLYNCWKRKRLYYISVMWLVEIVEMTGFRRLE